MVASAALAGIDDPRLKKISEFYNELLSLRSLLEEALQAYLD
jgi:hypothetical protein